MSPISTEDVSFCVQGISEHFNLSLIRVKTSELDARVCKLSGETPVHPLSEHEANHILKLKFLLDVLI